MVWQLESDPYRCFPGDPIALHINSSRETLSILCITTEGIDDVHTSDVTCLRAAQTRLPLHKIILAAQSTFAPSKAAFNGGLQPTSPRSIEDCDKTSHHACREESSHHLHSSARSEHIPSLDTLLIIGHCSVARTYRQRPVCQYSRDLSRKKVYREEHQLFVQGSRCQRRRPSLLDSCIQFYRPQLSCGASSYVRDICEE